MSSSSEIIPPPYESSDLCLACGLCCQGILFSRATLLRSELLAAERLGLIVLEKEDGLFFQLPCRYFVENKCSIYSDRLFVCRGFRCKLLVQFQTEQVTFEKALLIIKQAKSLIKAIKEQLPISDQAFFWRQLSDIKDVTEAYTSIKSNKISANLIMEIASLNVLLKSKFDHKKESHSAS